MTIGIYAITHSASGKKYYGQSAHIEKRWATHRHGLSQRKHPNAHLQRAWLKYGEAAFTFEIVVICDLAELNAIEEQLLADHVGPRCYNIALSPTAPMRGRKHTAKTRTKMACAHRTRKPEIRRQQTEALIRWNKSAEGRALRAALSRGRKPTKTTIEKIRRAHTGRRRSAQARANIAAGCKKRGPVSQATKDKKNAALRGKKRSKRAVKNLQQGAATRWADPAYRKKQAEAVRLSWIKRRQRSRDTSLVKS
jgi:group I intron endonuclease